MHNQNTEGQKIIYQESRVVSDSSGCTKTSEKISATGYMNDRFTNYHISKNAERINFVKSCGELLHVAKPHLLSCQLKFGRDIEDIHEKFGYPSIIPEGEYVVVTCENGYQYNIYIEGNSLCAIASEIFSKMAHK